MIDYLLLSSLCLLLFAELYRIYQSQKYIEQNKIIIKELESKVKQLNEIVKLLKVLEETTES